MTAIETSYRGYRMRSRLEARWACFWDHLETDWEYEPQGYVVGGRPYLPDFRLPTGTWVEVKGSESELDHDLMLAAAEELPGDADPILLILGQIPEPPGLNRGNWAWLGLSRVFDPDGNVVVVDNWWEFSVDGWPVVARKTECPPPYSWGDDVPWLTPVLNMTGSVPAPVVAAYRAARSARFEHGENGPKR
jgi:hypothetical protein